MLDDTRINPQATEHMLICKLFDLFQIRYIVCMKFSQPMRHLALRATAALLGSAGSLCVQAAPAMDPNLPAVLRPQVQAAVLAALPTALQNQVQVQLHFAAARGAAQKRCTDRWHVGPIDVQQLARISVPLECLGERGSVVARVQLHGPVAHLVQDAPAQHRLRPQDITTRTAPIAHADRWLDSAQLPGQLLRKATAAHTPLDTRAVERPVLLRRGDAVQILAHGGGVSVRVAGIATATARLGDTVTVRNARTQQLIKGRLTAPGVVEAGHEPLPGQRSVKVLPESTD